MPTRVALGIINSSPSMLVRRVVFIPTEFTVPFLSPIAMKSPGLKGLSK